MGLLSLGTPLKWEEAKKYADHVRYHGISQFLSIWEKLKDRQGDELLWGDEVSTPHLLCPGFDVNVYKDRIYGCLVRR
jgi:hypothetical protein